jgi:hypothetical protein
VTAASPPTPGRNIQIIGHVIGASDKTSDIGGTGNICRIQNCPRRFDHGEQGLAGQFRDALRLISIFHLWQHHEITVRIANSGHIGLMFLRVWAVHPDCCELPLKAVRHRFNRSQARFILHARLHGIFEVKDDHVRKKPTRFLNRPEIGSGQIECRARREG